ncbi:unnamed protein product, partial [Ectocarpus sp. 13 AM-2016]
DKTPRELWDDVVVAAYTQEHCYQVSIHKREKKKRLEIPIDCVSYGHCYQVLIHKREKKKRLEIPIDCVSYGQGLRTTGVVVNGDKHIGRRLSLPILVFSFK